MSRSRSPSPYKGNYRRRRSRSTSPTVLTKEEQLKKIADLTINNVGRRRDYNDIFGDEKDFWTSIHAEKRGDTNFDLEKAKTWWLKTNQTLPTKETARNILGNLIISTNTFNKIKKSCIDVICRDHLEEEVPDKWDDTLLKCTIAANIDDFQTSGIPTVSHYYMTNSAHNTTTNHPPDAQHQSFLRTTTQSLSYTHAHWRKSKRERTNHLTGTTHMSHIGHRLSSCHTSTT